MAKKLRNPVASLISVPLQSNWDFSIGPAHAMRLPAQRLAGGPDWGLRFAVTFLFPE